MQSSGAVNQSRGPVSSSASVTLAPAASSSSQLPDDVVFSQLNDELAVFTDRKAETEKALLEDLIGALRKQEKMLDADAWKYAAPRSRRLDIS